MVGVRIVGGRVGKAVLLGSVVAVGPPTGSSVCLSGGFCSS